MPRGTQYGADGSSHRLQPLMLLSSAGVGLATAEVVACRLPGWERDSYGYHGDDGRVFCGPPPGGVYVVGRRYGPTFGTGALLHLSRHTATVPPTRPLHGAAAHAHPAWFRSGVY